MTIRLETERLILRKPRKSDARILNKNDDDVAIRDFFMPYPKKKGLFDKLVKTCIKEWEEKKRYWFILELKDTKEIVGLSGIRDIDNYNKTGYLSFWIFKKYRRNSYLTETNIALNNFFFNKLKLRKLKTQVASFNKTSLAFHSKFRMREEGILRKENYNPYIKK